MRGIMCLLCVLFSGCAQYQSVTPTVIALFAHPDDETWVAGTLMHVQQHHINVVPVYVTSGDRGSDRSGRGLSGDKLANVREHETKQALQHLTLPPPVFLRYKDGQTSAQLSQIAADIDTIAKQYAAPVMLCFSQGGITANSDHVALAELCQSRYFAHQLVFSISNTRAERLEATAKAHQFEYPIKSAVTDTLISHRVDVTHFKAQKILAVDSHSTQFPAVIVNAFSAFVDQAPYEELIATAPSSRVQQVLNVLPHYNKKSNIDKHVRH
ncbi:hypothetical protein PULV_a1789 [Pseudoalteromonas ulvae UL12]|uniref:PIG-L deacetylase family protein n=1 Tax=Pseudoalteromonas ulvae TaxID=107327 RepID=UPI00186BA7F6|nr:PIG-L family deacetylase [Pseudoalteromonas ulvae]MBE0364203.1 hypothetical protein [Pseudoalteromonas ulvae UL12]